MLASSGSFRKRSLRPHPHLYEINTWVWLESVSRREGRNLSLAEVPDRDWDELATLGFDLVWLMGVWARSPLGRKMAQTDSHLFPLYQKALPGWHPDQVVGSPYSIRDYSPDPRIGSWSDLVAARRKLNSRNMGLILDFIPNHTGLDHVWVDSHPEYYIQATAQELDENPSLYYSIERNGRQPLILARGRDPYFPPWKDSAQLNLFHPGARAALLSEIQKISQHCDGVRCDMAMLVLADVFAKTWNQSLANFPRPAREFWSDAISASPDFIWLAEVYWGMEQRLQNLGFDFTYCKGFYDLLRDERLAVEMRAHFTAAASYQKKAVHFLENHDEARSAAIFGPEKLQAVATLLSAAPGLRMYHQGQLEGLRIHLPIELSEAAAEPPDPSTFAFYSRILAIVSQDVFHSGAWKLLALRNAGDASYENLIAFAWKLADDRSGSTAAGVSAAAGRSPSSPKGSAGSGASPVPWKIVVINLAETVSQGFLEIANEFSSAALYTLREELSGAIYPWNGSDIARDGLYVRIPPGSAQILTVLEESGG